MKKAFSFIIVLTILLPLLTGCQTSQEMDVLSIEPLSEELKTTIRNEYLIKYNADFSWDMADGKSSYFGTINNCVILLPTGKDFLHGMVMHHQFEIAGHTFESNKPYDLFAYRDGEICKLEEAYEQGWLTKDHIGKICEKYNVDYKEYQQHVEETNNG